MPSSFTKSSSVPWADVAPCLTEELTVGGQPTVRHVWLSVPAEHCVLGEKVLERLNHVSFAKSVKKEDCPSVGPKLLQLHRQDAIAEPPNEAMLIDPCLPLESTFHTAGITLLVEPVPRGHGDFALALEDKPRWNFHNMVSASGQHHGGKAALPPTRNADPPLSGAGHFVHVEPRFFQDTQHTQNPNCVKRVMTKDLILELNSLCENALVNIAGGVGASLRARPAVEFLALLNVPRTNCKNNTVCGYRVLDTAPSPHVVTLAGVVPVHTDTF